MERVAFEPKAPRSGWRDYHRVSRTATYGFLMALPLLVLYEGLIWLVNQGEVMQVRISAEVWMKRVLPTLGTTGTHVLALVVLLIGIGIYFYERKKHIPIRPRYMGWIIGESAIYAVVLAFLVSMVVGMIFAAAPTAQMAEQGLAMKLALSIGAGLYEELLFRVVLVGGMFAALQMFISENNRTLAYVIAAVIGALIFSWVHYIGALGDPFTLSSFTFRFLFGLALNVVFLVRGFGVAAWTHALYDVMIVTGLLG